MNETRHILKTWPAPFESVLCGQKRHEIRKNDRGFQQWDCLELREWDPNTREYSGRFLTCLVTHLTAGGEWGLPADLCVMSVQFQSSGIWFPVPGKWIALHGEKP